MASDADKKYKDQGSSFGITFAPIFDALESAYDAWMDADQVYSDAVNGKLEEAARLMADAGFTAADFAGDAIDSAIMNNFGLPAQAIWDWVKETTTSAIVAPLVSAAEATAKGVADVATDVSGTVAEKATEWTKEGADVAEAAARSVARGSEKAVEGVLAGGETAGRAIADVATDVSGAVAGKATEWSKEVSEQTVNVLESIYDAWMKADQVYTDQVELELKTAGKFFADLGISIADISNRIDKELLDIDKAIGRWFAKEGKALAKAFQQGEDGRFGWEKSLTKALGNFGKDFLKRVEEMDLDPDLQDGADVFANELDARITNLQLLVRTASGDELEDVPAWKAEIDLLTGRLETMPEDGEPEALAEWMAGTPDMPEGLRVTDTFSVRGDDKQILEDAVEKVEYEAGLYGPSLDDINPERLAAIRAGEDLEAGERDKWTSESGNRRRTITPEEQIIEDKQARQDRRNDRQEAALAEAEAGVVPDGRPAWEQRQDFLAATAVAEGWTAPGREPPAGDGDGDDGDGDDELTDEAYKYITENFGSVEFFLTTKAKEMMIDTPRGPMNVITWLEEEQEENPDVIWGLFQQTKWFALNGPAARQFQVDWDKAGGTDGWNPQWNETGMGGWMNMTPDMEEMLDDTYDSLMLEAARIGISTDTAAKKEAIMQMAYNARQLNMTDYELKNEFIENIALAFDPNAVKNSGTFGAIRNKLKSNAATYMISIGDQALDTLSQQIYLNKATYEGLSAVWAQQAREDNPAVASLIDQGYTPSAYFSSYANVASNLLGRQIDLLGNDNKMFEALTDTMIDEKTGLQRPMTRGEFKRYVRGTPEWDGTENARDEAYSTVGTLLDSFGVKV